MPNGTLALSLLMAFGALAVWTVAWLAGRRAGAPAWAAQAQVRLTEKVLADLARLGQAHERLRLELHQGREDSLRGLADVAQGLQGRIAAAQRDLAEVKALERSRARQMDRTSDSLRRLETIVAGSSSRGAAGENILSRALAQLPPDLLETNAAFGGRVVEYALRLPDGRLLPVDSKWTSAESLDRLETTDDPAQRRRLQDAIARDVRARIREMARYLDSERTLSLAVLAVPDAVHSATPETHAEGWRDGVLVVPYSLVLPFLLTLYRFAVRLVSLPGADDAERGARLERVGEGLRRLDETVEGRLSRALVQAGNARDDIRAELAVARRGLARSLSAIEAETTVDRGSFDPPPGRR
jgi:DNA recombination protein RmuC